MQVINLLSDLLKRGAGNGYYQLAGAPLINPVYNALRVRRNYRRYGVKSAWMFRNVELEINSFCNRTCSYCPNVSAKRPHGQMEVALFNKIIDELAEIDFDGTVSYHFYGEPLLDKRLPDFVEHTALRVAKCRPRIYSNGDFLTLDIFRQYLRGGLKSFLITQHDNCMPANLQNILQNISEEESKFIEIRFANEVIMNNRSGLITTLGVPATPLHIACDWPLGFMTITMDGNAVLCCNDYFETEVMGNVRTSTLKEIWCSERYERLRSALSRGDRTTSNLCASCNAIPDDSTLHRIAPS